MKFYVKQKVFSFRDKFKISDENQKELFQVGGKFFSLQNKLELQNLDGSVVLHAKKQVLSFMPKYFIYTPHDEEVAIIQRKFGFKPKFEVSVGNDTLDVQGSLFGHSFQIYHNEQMVASIEKRVISWGDTYEIEVLVDNQTELFLFIVIIIDQVIHEQKQNRY